MKNEDENAYLAYRMKHFGYSSDSYDSDSNESDESCDGKPPPKSYTDIVKIPAQNSIENLIDVEDECTNKKNESLKHQNADALHSEDVAKNSLSVSPNYCETCGQILPNVFTNFISNENFSNHYSKDNIGINDLKSLIGIDMLIPIEDFGISSQFFLNKNYCQKHVKTNADIITISNVPQFKRAVAFINKNKHKTFGLENILKINQSITNKNPAFFIPIEESKPKAGAASLNQNSQKYITIGKSWAKVVNNLSNSSSPLTVSAVPLTNKINCIMEKQNIPTSSSKITKKNFIKPNKKSLNQNSSNQLKLKNFLPPEVLTVIDKSETFKEQTVNKKSSKRQRKKRSKQTSVLEQNTSKFIGKSLPENFSKPLQAFLSPELKTAFGKSETTKEQPMLNDSSKRITDSIKMATSISLEDQQEHSLSLKAENSTESTKNNSLLSLANIMENTFKGDTITWSCPVKNVNTKVETNVTQVYETKLFGGNDVLANLSHQGKSNQETLQKKINTMEGTHDFIEPIMTIFEHPLISKLAENKWSHISSIIESKKQPALKEGDIYDKSRLKKSALETTESGNRIYQIDSNFSENVLIYDSKFPKKHFLLENEDHILSKKGHSVIVEEENINTDYCDQAEVNENVLLKHNVYNEKREVGDIGVLNQNELCEVNEFNSYQSVEKNQQKNKSRHDFLEAPTTILEHSHVRKLAEKKWNHIEIRKQSTLTRKDTQDETEMENKSVKKTELKNIFVYPSISFQPILPGSDVNELRKETSSKQINENGNCTFLNVEINSSNKDRGTDNNSHISLQHADDSVDPQSACDQKEAYVKQGNTNFTDLKYLQNPSNNKDTFSADLFKKTSTNISRSSIVVNKPLVPDKTQGKKSKGKKKNKANSQLVEKANGSIEQIVDFNFSKKCKPTIEEESINVLKSKSYENKDSGSIFLNAEINSSNDVKNTDDNHMALQQHDLHTVVNFKVEKKIVEEMKRDNILTHNHENKSLNEITSTNNPSSSMSVGKQIAFVLNEKQAEKPKKTKKNKKLTKNQLVEKMNFIDELKADVNFSKKNQSTVEEESIKHIKSNSYENKETKCTFSNTYKSLSNEIKGTNNNNDLALQPPDLNTLSKVENEIVEEMERDEKLTHNNDKNENCIQCDANFPSVIKNKSLDKITSTNVNSSRMAVDNELAYVLDGQQAKKSKKKKNSTQNVANNQLVEKINDIDEPKTVFNFTKKSDATVGEEFLNVEKSFSDEVKHTGDNYMALQPPVLNTTFKLKDEIFEENDKKLTHNQEENENCIQYDPKCLSVIQNKSSDEITSTNIPCSSVSVNNQLLLDGKQSKKSKKKKKNKNIENNQLVEKVNDTNEQKTVTKFTVEEESVKQFQCKPYTKEHNKVESKETEKLENNILTSEMPNVLKPWDDASLCSLKRLECIHLQLADTIHGTQFLVNRLNDAYLSVQHVWNWDLLRIRKRKIKSPIKQIVEEMFGNFLNQNSFNRTDVANQSSQKTLTLKEIKGIADEMFNDFLIYILDPELNDNCFINSVRLEINYNLQPDLSDLLENLISKKHNEIFLVAHESSDLKIPQSTETCSLTELKEISEPLSVNNLEEVEGADKITQDLLNVENNIGVEIYFSASEEEEEEEESSFKSICVDSSIKYDFEDLSTDSTVSLDERLSLDNCYENDNKNFFKFMNQMSLLMTPKTKETCRDVINTLTILKEFKITDRQQISLDKDNLFAINSENSSEVSNKILGYSSLSNDSSSIKYFESARNNQDFPIKFDCTSQKPLSTSQNMEAVTEPNIDIQSHSSEEPLTSFNKKCVIS